MKLSVGVRLMTCRCALIALSCIFAREAQAQSDSIRRDTTTVLSESKYQVVTNKFWNNWFIGAGAGAQIFFGDHNKQMEFGDRLTPAFEFYFGKRFTPVVSTRLAVNGYQIKGVTQNGSHSTGVRYAKKPWEGYWLTNQEFEYYNAHADVMFNVNNMFWGYKPGRKFNVTPYVGLGWMLTWDNPKEREISANLGVLSSYRIGKGFAVTLDVRGSMVHDRFDGEEGNRKADGLLTAALGLAYNFRQREWKQPVTTIISYDEQAVNLLRARNIALANDNEALRQQLAKATNSAITEIKTEKQILVAPILVTFQINKSELSDLTKVNLKFFANAIKNDKSNTIYNVVGYADRGTGNSTINLRLSHDRAQAVYNFLVKDAGVDPSRIRADYKGGVGNMFYDNPRLSRAVITVLQ